MEFLPVMPEQADTMRHSFLSLIFTEHFLYAGYLVSNEETMVGQKRRGSPSAREFAGFIRG